jgi:quercetin dioxygenase-like cupin family protein
MQSTETKTGFVSRAPGRGEVVIQRDGLRVHHLVLSPGRELPEHTADDDVVVIITRGKGVIYVMQEPRHVEAGDILDFVPGESHSVEALDELEMIIVHAALAKHATAH